MKIEKSLKVTIDRDEALTLSRYHIEGENEAHGIKNHEGAIYHRDRAKFFEKLASEKQSA